MEERRRIGRWALSCVPGLRIFRAASAYARPRRGFVARYWPGWTLARARCSWAGTRARGARARARCDAGGDRRDRPRRRRSWHRQDTARLRAGETCPRRRARGARRSFDRSRRNRASVPAVRGGSASARGPVAGRRRTPGSQLRVFEETLALLDRPRRLHARAARTRGSALGRYLDARSRRLPLTQPRGAADPAARDLPRGRALVGRAHAEACGRSPTLGLGARSRARSARARRAGGAAGSPPRRFPSGGRGEHHRRPLGGQSLLRRGAPRRRQRRPRRAPAQPARPAPSARDPTRPFDAKPVAPGRGRRTRRRVSAAQCSGGAPRA